MNDFFGNRLKIFIRGSAHGNVWDIEPETFLTDFEKGGELLDSIGVFLFMNVPRLFPGGWNNRHETFCIL